MKESRFEGEDQEKKRSKNNVAYAIERVYERRLIYFVNDNDSVEIFRTHARTHECAKKNEEETKEI